jgi:malate synthase
MTIEATLLNNRIEVLARMEDNYYSILTPEAMEFVTKLHNNFNARRLELLKKRKIRQQEINAGRLPDFLPETKHIRESNWQALPVLPDIQDRRVEITGPVDRKMIINALNSGAKVFMADFEDSTAPTFRNIIDGQINLKAAINREIDFTSPEGKAYKLNEKTAVLFVRPRGWHLDEKNFKVDGDSVSGALADFGLYFFHNYKKLIANGSAPYFYLPKMESHLEARLWNDVFNFAEEEFNLPEGTIKATVLIETILAAFEMEEIIYELRTHICGLNAGRWDYIFSAIKKFSGFANKLFPDRVQVSMNVPFMRAYAKLLVKTCHKRGIHAMGGMAAFIPSRKDEEINRQAFNKVKADKDLEAQTGFDGTWVAHPDLVKVAMESFDNIIGQKPNQKDEKTSESYQISAQDLIDFNVPEGKITEAGLRLNINVGILYIESWLMGVGAAGLYNLMEDAATAEISRAQAWQWIHHQAKMDDGRTVTSELYKKILPEELEKIKNYVGETRYEAGKFALATEIFDKMVMDENFPEFLTLKAYQYF